MSRGFEKIERENPLGKKGGPSGWQDSDMPREYWSTRAMQKIPLKEAYPQRPDESNEAYDERLAEMRKTITEAEFPQYPNETSEAYAERIESLQKSLGKAASFLSSPDLDWDYAYGELDEHGQLNTDSVQTTKVIDGKTRRVAHGYRFAEYQPHSNPEDFLTSDEIDMKQRTERLKNFTEVAIRGATEARRSDSAKHIKTISEIKRSNSTIEQIARYYVGSLGYEDEIKAMGALAERFDEERYGEDDRKTVERLRAREAKKDRERGGTAIGMRRAGKVFEGFFYPFVERGFFSSSETPTSFVIPSEYDDKCNGIDAAAIIPVVSIEYAESDDEADKEILTQQLICFDLTTSAGGHERSDKPAIKKDKGKIEKALNRFWGNESDGVDGHFGLADFTYPTSCTGEELPSLSGIPHFVLCLSRPQAREFEESLAKGEMPSEEIQFLINYQIQWQATVALNYWKTQPNQSETVETFRRIHEYFYNRAAANARRMGVRRDDILDNDDNAITVSYTARLVSSARERGYLK